MDSHLLFKATITSYFTAIQKQLLNVVIEFYILAKQERKQTTCSPAI